MSSATVLDVTALNPATSDVARALPFPIAVVDVETSGLVAERDRILSVAVVEIGADGSPGEWWTTLLDPGCDPGPVHIHGLTRERLAGSPEFTDIAGELAARLAGRVMVAHNASFDWRFLTAEAARAGLRLPIERRLCSCVLARRLDLPIPDFRLATLADYWSVPFERQHDALADAMVVAEVLPRMLALAAEQDLELPITSGGRAPTPAPARRASVRCEFVNPGRLSGGGLVQGMRVAFTGETTRPRVALEQLALDAGLALAASVSRRTSLLVTNTVGASSHKAKSAAEHGIPVIDEETFRRLAANVAAGRRRDVTRARAEAAPPPRLTA